MARNRLISWEVEGVLNRGIKKAHHIHSSIILFAGYSDNLTGGVCLFAKGKETRFFFLHFFINLFFLVMKFVDSPHNSNSSDCCQSQNNSSCQSHRKQVGDEGVL